MSKANQFLEGEDAVSPVIGVILMVAITVILAAVIAAFVFGMGPPEQAPQASIRLSDASKATNNITLQHQGGDVIDLTKTTITVTQEGKLLKITPTMSSGSKYSAGDMLVVKTNDGSPGKSAVYLNGNVTPIDTSGANFTIATGEIAVTMIDTVSGQMIANVNYRV